MTRPNSHSRWTRLVNAILILGILSAGSAMAGEHRIGFGVRYLKSVEDLANDDFSVDQDGLIPVVSYQYRPSGLFFLEVDLEYFYDGFYTSVGSAYSPQALFMVGRGLYGGLGLGFKIIDDLAIVSDPVYLARVGWSTRVLPRISFDLHVNYAAGTSSSLESFDQDALTLGAMVRVGL